MGSQQTNRMSHGVARCIYNACFWKRFGNAGHTCLAPSSLHTVGWQMCHFGSFAGAHPLFASMWSSWKKAGCVRVYIYMCIYVYMCVYCIYTYAVVSTVLFFYWI
jgi:hypothetical protein